MGETTARGAQTYKIIVKDSKKIIDALNQIQKSNKSKFPHMVELNVPPKSETISGIIAVSYYESGANIHEEVYFEFNMSKSRCYLVGRSGGRDAVVLQLNYNLDKEDRIKSIQAFKLNGKSIYKDMLAIIKSVDDDNFIKTLGAKFGIVGQKSPLAKHSVTGIKYGFISNTCVSKDPNSEEYAEKSSSCKITFGVWKFGNFERPKEKK